MDIRDNHATELARLSAELAAMRSELAQLRGQRPQQDVPFRDIRWVKTTESGSAWPTTQANTFPVRFLDAHFTASQGNQTFSSTNRQAAAQPFTYAHARTGWIPKDLPLPAFHQRGLGGDTAGVWWILDPPRSYFGKLATSLTFNGEPDSVPASCTFTIWLLGASGWYSSGCTVTAYNRLGDNGSIPAGTPGRIEWEHELRAWVLDGNWQRYVERGCLILAEDMCGTPPVYFSASWVPDPHGLEILNTGVPVYVDNPARLCGQAGDRIWVERTNNIAPFTWRVYLAEGKEVEVHQTRWYESSKRIERRKRKVCVNTCEEWGEWEELLAFGSCS